MASNLLAMASNLEAMASNPRARVHFIHVILLELQVWISLTTLPAKMQRLCLSPGCVGILYSDLTKSTEHNIILETSFIHLLDILREDSVGALAPFVINGGIVEARTGKDVAGSFCNQNFAVNILQNFCQAKEFTFEMKDMWRKSAMKLSAWENSQWLTLRNCFCHSVYIQYTVYSVVIFLVTLQPTARPVD